MTHECWDVCVHACGRTRPPTADVRRAKGQPGGVQGCESGGEGPGATQCAVITTRHTQQGTLSWGSNDSRHIARAPVAAPTDHVAAN